MPRSAGGRGDYADLVVGALQALPHGGDASVAGADDRVDRALRQVVAKVGAQVLRHLPRPRRLPQHVQALREQAPLQHLAPCEVVLRDWCAKLPEQTTPLTRYMQAGPASELLQMPRQCSVHSWRAVLPTVQAGLHDGPGANAMTCYKHWHVMDVEQFGEQPRSPGGTCTVGRRTQRTPPC